MSIPSGLKCTDINCPQYLSVKRRSSPHKNDISMDKIDWYHMEENHLRQFADFHKEKCGKLQAEAEKLQKEIQDLKNLMNSKSASAAKLAPEDLVADPINHVDGVCDAIVAHGVNIYKCTEHVRFGKNVCAIHLKHQHLVGVATSSASTSGSMASTASTVATSVTASAKKTQVKAESAKNVQNTKSSAQQIKILPSKNAQKDLTPTNWAEVMSKS